MPTQAAFIAKMWLDSARVLLSQRVGAEGGGDGGEEKVYNTGLGDGDDMYKIHDEDDLYQYDEAYQEEFAESYTDFNYDWDVTGQGGPELDWGGVEVAGDAVEGLVVEDIDAGWGVEEGGSAEGPPAVTTIARSTAAFESTDQTELGFPEDTFIAVTNEDQSGWWFGFILPDAFQGEGGVEMFQELGEAEKTDMMTRSGWFPETFVCSV